MDIIQLKTEAIRIINNNPGYKDEITELYYLAKSEIEDGGSEEHECELAYNDMLEYENNS